MSTTNCGTVRLIPGPQGPPGTPGTPGTDGVSAFTVTTADFTMPAALGTVVVAVADSSWMAVGEPLFVLGAGTFQVTATAAQSVTLANLGYGENITPGTVIASGAQVTPSGWKGDKGDNGSTTGLLVAANNLSDVVSASSSRSNLGLGTAATHPVGDFAQTANNLSDLANVATARTNLGLGTAAVQAATAFLGSTNNLSEILALGAGAQAIARTNLGIVGGILSAALVQEIYGNGVAGGSSATADYTSRIINNEAFDPDNIVTVGSGNFTLQAGHYILIALAPANMVDAHRLALYDGSSNITYGTAASAAASDNVSNLAFLIARITPAGATTYTIRHYTTTAQASNGLGLPVLTVGVSEVYCQVLILKQS